MSVESLTGLISGGIGAVAVLGIWLALMVSGKLHSDDEFQREIKRGDLAEAARLEMQRAYQEANARAETAVHALEILSEAIHRPRDDKA